MNLVIERKRDLGGIMSKLRKKRFQCHEIIEVNFHDRRKLLKLNRIGNIICKNKTFFYFRKQLF